MTPRQRRARLFVVLALPALVLLVGRLAARSAARGEVDSVERHLASQAERLQSDFRVLLEEAERVAHRALDDSPAAPARAAPGLLAGRLEGAGRLGADNTFREWTGMPEEPGPAPKGRGPDWSVRVEGLWTRLVVRVGPDPSGGSGLASFLLDGPFPDERFLDLLPHGVDRDTLVDVEFVEEDEAAEDLRRLGGEGSGVFRKGQPPGLFLPLTSSTGAVLALATLREVPPAQRASFWIGLGQALAAVAFALLLAGLFAWTALPRTGAGALLAIGAAVAARVALLLARAPSRLLPREMGSPTLYGSPEAFGLLGSPADLFLTCLTCFLAWRAVRVLVRDRDPSFPRLARLTGAAAAVAATVLVVVLAQILARDARVPLLDLGSLARSPGHALLLAGLALLLVSAAEAWSLVSSVSLRSRREEAPLWRALALLPLAALSSWALLRTTDRLATDRLRSEFAPQVLEQSSRRRVALVASVREAASSDAAADAVLATVEPGDSYAAYLLWASGDLFHAGYQSSLDLYDAQGVRRSHFGFGVPALREEAQVQPPAAGFDPVVREGTFFEGARPLRFLHAAAAIVREGKSVGTVVGHVLDEPDNLPFLPGSLPYLAALGFGAPRAEQEDSSGAPGYVLYARDGSVVLSSLGQPPAPVPALREAAAGGRVVRLVAGEEPYVALPLTDGERLHLLLLPTLTWLDRLGAFLRMCLLGLGATVVLAVLELGAHPRSLLRAVRSLRGSFYRKLLVALLLASVVPVLSLSLFLRGYVERRAQAALIESASHLVEVAKSVVEDYAASLVADEPMAATPELDDEILDWLRRVVRQEIHLYENGLVSATSKRELFASGLLPVRIPGEVEERLVREAVPHVVQSMRLGPATIPVAYVRVHLPGAPAREAVAAVPLVLQQRELSRARSRVGEMLLLATVLLAVLLAGTAALLARTVARPVRALVGATRRIASGDYATRLRAETRDELAQLVEGFNAMAAALAAQRADLERRRDYIETLLRNATAGVVSTDPAGRIVTLNPAAAELLAGPDGPPRVGEPLVAAVSRARELAPLAGALLQPARPGEDPREVDLEQSGKARRLRLVRVGLPDPEGGPPGSLLLLDDVTDLMRSNQLAAWAEMARAIAHEIKNPLTPIQLATEHLGRLLRDRKVLPWQEVEACLDTVIKQVRALREIAAQFSTYAKLPDLARVPTDAAELLREALAPYRPALPPGIRLEERYEPAPSVPVDRRVLSRALVNLVENALQAMAAGGTLRVAVTHESSRREVVLSVADTGPGLAPEVRARLFEPYFSTKSSGTGLGLAIVRQAVEAHQGRIEVESGAGRGTVFRIHLPAG